MQKGNCKRLLWIEEWTVDVVVTFFYFLQMVPSDAGGKLVKGALRNSWVTSASVEAREIQREKDCCSSLSLSLSLSLFLSLTHTVTLGFFRGWSCWLPDAFWWYTVQCLLHSQLASSILHLYFTLLLLGEKEKNEKSHIWITSWRNESTIPFMMVREREVKGLPMN